MIVDIIIADIAILLALYLWDNGFCKRWEDLML